MNKKDLLRKLKIELGMIKFMDFPMLEGDAIVRAEALEVGQAALLVADDGSESPAPEGEHALADGTKIRVDAEGLITEVVIPEGEAEAEVEMKPITQEQLSKIQAAFAAGTPEERLANLEMLSKALMEYAFGWELREAESRAIRENAISIYKTAMSSIKADFEASKVKFSQVEKLVAELSEEPAAKPIKAGATTTFSKEENKSEKFDLSNMTIDQRATFFMNQNYSN